MKDWRHALSVFRDSVAYTMRAPDNFPKEDYLPADEQMNLDRAYERLQADFKAFLDAFGQSPQTAEWQADINESYELYKKGENLAGMQRLNKLFNSLWGVKKKKP